MATSDAIATTTSAVVNTLRDALPAPLASVVTVEFAHPPDLAAGLPPGRLPKVTVCLYRVTVDEAHRSAPGSRALALDLHYLVAPWGQWGGPEQLLLGWIMQTFHDTPALSAAVLNASHPGDPVFGPGEAVQVVWEPLSIQDLGAVGHLAPANQRPSATYVARPVRIDGRDL